MIMQDINDLVKIIVYYSFVKMGLTISIPFI